jgi:hypothetical protein
MVMRDVKYGWMIYIHADLAAFIFIFVCLLDGLTTSVVSTCVATLQREIGLFFHLALYKR